MTSSKSIVHIYFVIGAKLPLNFCLSSKNTLLSDKMLIYIELDLKNPLIFLRDAGCSLLRAPLEGTLRLRTELGLRKRIRTVRGVGGAVQEAGGGGKNL